MLQWSKMAHQHAHTAGALGDTKHLPSGGQNSYTCSSLASKVPRKRLLKGSAVNVHKHGLPYKYAVMVSGGRESLEIPQGGNRTAPALLAAEASEESWDPALTQVQVHPLPNPSSVLLYTQHSYAARAPTC